MKGDTTEKPWGSFTRFTHNEASTVKILRVKAGEAFSLQYHNKREEFWKIISGNPTVRIGEETFSAHEGDEFTIAPTVMHRITAEGDDAVVLEISTGDFAEDDIVRVEDKYGRA